VMAVTDSALDAKLDRLGEQTSTRLIVASGPDPEF